LPCDKASVLSTFSVKLGVGVCRIGISGVVNLVVGILVENVVFSVVCGVVVGVKVVCGVVWERLLRTSLPLVHCLFGRIILNLF